MKKIILIIFLVLASENASASKSDVFSSKPIDGAVLYAKHCALCHGDKAQKSPVENIAPLAGMNATLLARITRSYRDQDEKHGNAHSIYRENQIMKEATSNLSNKQIGAIAKHINSLAR